LLASTLLFCLNIPHPAVTSFLVLYTQEIGIGHIEWYFVVSGLTSLLARPALGRISDNIGCGRSLAVAFVFETLAVLTLVAASGLTLVLVSGTLYALGAGLGTATTLALAMRHANPQHLGRAMATFSIAFPLSVGVGALLSGSAVEVAGYTGMFFVVAAVAAGGFLLTLANWPNLE
jgi:predicted MFS family arabinose efflux permease